MKVRTVSLLAALGMSLTSVTVWSLTPPSGFGEASATPDWEPSSGDDTVSPGDVKLASTFTSGDKLMLRGRVGHPVLASGKSNETFVMLEVEAGDAVGSQRAPLELAIVIDRSGSMKGKRLDNALRAARGMVARLSDGDTVSVIAYDSSAELVVPPTRVDSFARRRVERALDDIRAQGNTCISCGLDEALARLGRERGAVSRVLLLSDGEATDGIKTVAGFRQLASRARERGVSISSLGVDLDYNERVLEALAFDSNGNHYFIENATQLVSAFDKELNGLAKTVADDGRIELSLADGVELEHVYFRRFDRTGDKVSVDLGSFSEKQTKSLLVRVRVPEGFDVTKPLVRADFSYANVGGGPRGTCNGALGVQLSPDPGRVSQLDPVVAARLSSAETAAALDTANALLATGNAEEAEKTLDATISKLAKRKQTASSRAKGADKSRIDFEFDEIDGALEKAKGGATRARTAPKPQQKAEAKRAGKQATELANPFR